MERFNGIDILFIILIGIYLIAFIFIIMYICNIFLENLDKKRKFIKQETINLKFKKKDE